MISNLHDGVTHASVIENVPPGRPKLRDYCFAVDAAPESIAVPRPNVREEPSLETHLSLDDAVALAELDAVHDLIRDRVKQVVHRRATGFVLSGAGGLGKSHLVISTLRESGTPFELCNSQMTPKGLFIALKARPTSIFLVEDVEQLFDSSTSAGLLRSALWSQDERDTEGYLPRQITWQTNAGNDTFRFRGGLIVLLNGSVPDTPQTQAMMTRINCFNLTVSDVQMRAKMREMACAGYTDGDSTLTVQACREVCEFVIEQLQSKGAAPNLRMLINAFRDRCSFEAGQTATKWEELIRSSIAQTPASASTPASKAAELEQDLEVLADILKQTENTTERIRLFGEATGHSKPTYYRRKKELDRRLA